MVAKQCSAGLFSKPYISITTINDKEPPQVKILHYKQETISSFTDLWNAYVFAVPKFLAEHWVDPMEYQ